MTYDELVERIVSVSSNRENLDNVPNLLTKINMSLLQVCRDGTPMFLLKKNGSSRQFFKRIDHEHYICVPLPIKENTLEIELDPGLIDALAYHVMAGIETGRASQYMGMYWNIIDNNEQNVINSTIAHETWVPADYVNDIDGAIFDTNEYLLAFESGDLSTLGGVYGLM